MNKTMKVYTVYNNKPLSYNKSKSEAKRQYKEELQRDFVEKYQKLYSDLPMKATVETRIAYYNHVQHKDQIADIDNISKPTVDAYKGYIYEDDNQVIQRIAMRHDVNRWETVDIDCSEMPYEIVQEIQRYVNSKRDHLLLFSVTPINEEDLMSV